LENKKMMLVTLKTYQNLRSKGLARAWEISGMPEVGDRIVGAVTAFLFACGCLFLISDYANAIETRAADGAKEEIAQLADYTKALEGVLALCLSRSDSPVWIGDELFMCAAVPTGVKK
jgi:hypothetical protein